MKKQSSFQRLVDAMHECANASGNAQWTNGYRTGRPGKEAELHAKEMAQWEAAGKAEEQFRRVCRSVLREARRTSMKTEGR